MNQKGIAHLVLLLAVVGAVLGVYLIKSSKIYNPLTSSSPNSSSRSSATSEGRPRNLPPIPMPPFPGSPLPIPGSPIPFPGSPPPVPSFGPKSAKISASPNPCYLSGALTCTSTISWESVNAPDLTIEIKENPGSLFARAPYGKKDAKWITENGATFQAYSGGILLDSLKVTGVNKSDSSCTVTYRSGQLHVNTCKTGYYCDTSGSSGGGCTDSTQSSTCVMSGICKSGSDSESCTITYKSDQTQEDSCGYGKNCVTSGIKECNTPDGNCTSTGYCQTVSSQSCSVTYHQNGGSDDSCPSGNYCKTNAVKECTMSNGDCFSSGKCEIKPNPYDN